MDYLLTYETGRQVIIGRRRRTGFGNWPTVPQLYVKGQLVGGSDIMMEMYQKGELQKLITEAQGAAAK